ncbi:MAG: PAS domain S-box protein [Desulfomonilaceae bacterium]
MQEHEKTQDQLIDELNEMRRKVAELKAARSAVVDIDEIEQSVRDLKLKTEEQDLLLNTIDTQIWYLTDSETHGLVNQSRADFLGKRREEIENKKLYDFYSQDVADICKAGNAEVFRSGRAIHTEEWIPNAAGEPRLISITKTPKLDERGEVEYVVCTGTDITQRKQTEEALAESKRFLSNVFASIPDGISVLDKDMNIMMTNQTMERWYAHALPFKGKKCYEVYHGLSQPCQVCPTIQTLQTGISAVELVPMTGKVGTKIGWLELYSFPLSDIATGEITGAIEFLRDISEKKQIENALRDSEERHRSLVEHLPQRIFMKDRNSVYLSCNRNYASDLGITPEEIVGKDDFAFHSPELAQMYRSDDRDCIATDTVKDTEKPYQLNGQQRWAHTIKVPYHDRLGQIIGLLGIYEDITDRKRTGEALKESEQRFRGVFEQGPVGMAMVSLDYRWLAVNQRLCEITGYSSEELTKLSFVDITHPDDIAQDLAQAAALARGDIPYHQIQKRYIKKDKEIAWINLTATIIRNNQNEPMYFLSMMEDITARKKSEQEEEYLRNQLFQSQKLEALGTLVGGIAHDFNNMLQIILGYSELLLIGKKRDDPVYKGLQTIIQTGRGGAELVKKLLALGQQGQIVSVPLDLNHQISRLTTLISRTLPQVVQLDIDLTHGPMTIHADPNQIDQVVMDLAINASEAMPNGGRLKIATTAVSLDEEYCRLHHGAKPDNYVMLSVKDTGRGMDKETRARIFDPFFSTKQRGSTRGTGLGLSVVQGIVKQHGGQVICESEPGEGTEFKIYFPAIATTLIKPKTVVPTVKCGGTETILVVEDNIPVAELEQTTLEDAGYTVIMATNGQEALDIYQTKKDQISLVILDLMMPEMSGKDCLMELVKIDPAVKVLIASGYAPEDELHKEINPLIKGFVHKPFELTQLLDEVGSVLRNN